MREYSRASQKCEVPALLRQLPRWTTWTLRPAPHNGRPTKVPSCSPRRLDLATTFPFRERRDEHGGVGFLFVGGVTFEGVDGTRYRLLALDLDACRDPLTDQITDWAADIVDHCGRSYTEVSPSGYGLRVFVLVPADAVPAGLAAKGRAGERAPGTDKAPEVQLFGHNDAPTYVTVTGRRLLASHEGIVTLPSIDWLITTYALATNSEAASARVPVGTGVPPSHPEITAGVMAAKHGAEMIAADWERVTGRKTASECYHLLVVAALRAARGHGEIVVDWLLHCTAWGTGDVVSRDPGKYARESWVRAEVARASVKRARDVDPASAFEPLDVGNQTPENETANPGVTSSGQRVTASHGDAPVTRRESGSPLQVLDDWESDGPLVHLPTGIPSLDACTGGGLVLGSRVYLVGAPDAGKTALAVQLLDHYLSQGVPVAILAIDEEPGDILTRLLQRRGLTRVECEQRAPVTLARARELLTGLPVRIYDAGMTIEAAAVALHRAAVERSPGVDRPPAVLVVDSVQTARCEGETGDETAYRAVSMRVAAIRAAATRYRMLVIATSEMNRGAYRSRKSEENAADMAAAKESGAIEFSARVMLTLRSVPDVPDVVECRVTKNKHGPATRTGEDGIFLRFDRGAQQLVEDGDFRPVGDDETNAHAERVEAAARLAYLIATQEKIGRNAAIAALDPTVSARRVRDARAWLIEVGAICETVGKQRLRSMELVAEKLPPDVRKRFEELLAG